MRLELIKEFQAFAITQNLSRTAKELHITQSCLSKHMAELEAETGLKLLNRGQTNVSLTAVGKYFLQESSSILSAWDDVLRCCKEMQKVRGSAFIIQSFLEDNTANKVLYRWGRDYHKTHPNLDISYVKLAGFAPAEALMKGVVDIALDLRCEDVLSFADKAAQLQLAVVPVQTDPIVVWFRKDNYLSQVDTLSLDLFERIPIMTSVSDRFDYMRAMTKQLFRDNGMVPFLKPVHFDIDSPASFFLSEFDDTCVMFTTVGMLDNQCLNTRDDITYKITTDPRMNATTFLLASLENQTAQEFLECAKECLKARE